MRNYDDIIHLPHYQSATHPHMSMRDRAVQFTPFAALTGFGAAIDETKRLTDERMDLTEDEKQELNTKLCFIAEHLNTSPEIAITYFVPDRRKTGGAYLTAFGVVKKIDAYENYVILQDEQKIPINDIIQINGEIFSPFDIEL